MCTYSNIGEIGKATWPSPWDASPYNQGLPFVQKPYNGPTKEQFEEFLQLMRQAKKFDKAMGHPDCEQAEKIQWIKELATYLGCDVSDLTK